MVKVLLDCLGPGSLVDEFVIEGTIYVLSTRQTMPFSQKDMQKRMKMTESCCLKIFWVQNFVSGLSDVQQ